MPADLSDRAGNNNHGSSNETFAPFDARLGTFRVGGGDRGAACRVVGPVEPRARGRAAASAPVRHARLHRADVRGSHRLDRPFRCSPAAPRRTRRRLPTRSAYFAFTSMIRSTQMASFSPGLAWGNRGPSNLIRAQTSNFWSGLAGSKTLSTSSWMIQLQKKYT